MSVAVASVPGSCGPAPALPHPPPPHTPPRSFVGAAEQRGPRTRLAVGHGPLPIPSPRHPPPGASLRALVPRPNGPAMRAFPVQKARPAMGRVAPAGGPSDGGSGGRHDPQLPGAPGGRAAAGGVRRVQGRGLGDDGVGLRAHGLGALGRGRVCGGLGCETAADDELGLGGAAVTRWPPLLLPPTFPSPPQPLLCLLHLPPPALSVSVPRLCPRAGPQLTAPPFFLPRTGQQMAKPSEVANRRSPSVGGRSRMGGR